MRVEKTISVVRCRYCAEHTEFKVMARREHHYIWVNCGHNLAPDVPDYGCSCWKCRKHQHPLVMTRAQPLSFPTPDEQRKIERLLTALKEKKLFFREGDTDHLIRRLHSNAGEHECSQDYASHDLDAIAMRKMFGRRGLDGVPGLVLVTLDEGISTESVQSSLRG